MSQDGVIPVANNTKSRNDLIERGFSRQPLRIDVETARSLEALAHAAWSIPKDKYYDGGDRFPTFRPLFRLGGRWSASIPSEHSASMSLRQAHPMQEISIARIRAYGIPCRIHFDEAQTETCIVSLVKP